MSDSDEGSGSGSPPPNTNSNQSQTVLEDADGNTLRIMLSTDNHLGYAERDPVRGMYMYICTC
jgi:hypothetical protein